MSKQKKGDYKGKEIVDKPTLMCDELCFYVEKAFNAIKAYFEGSVMVILMTEFGIEIHE